MAETIVNGDGRTLARLDERTEHIQRTVDEIKQLFTALDCRMRAAENDISAIKGKWSVLLIAISALVSLAINALLR